MKKIKWVVKMFRKWRLQRNSRIGTQFIDCDLDHKNTITEELTVLL